MNFKKVRDETLEIFKEALEAADPERCMLEHIKLRGNILIVDGIEYDLEAYSSIFVVAFGKASPAMGKALERLLGDRIKEGLVVSNTLPKFTFSRLKLYLASHPIPDERSVIAATEVIKLLEQTGERDLVI